MELYHGRLDKKPSALAIRIRSPPLPPGSLYCNASAKLANHPTNHFATHFVNHSVKDLLQNTLYSILQPPAKHPFSHFANHSLSRGTILYTTLQTSRKAPSKPLCVFALLYKPPFDTTLQTPCKPPCKPLCTPPPTAACQPSDASHVGNAAASRFMSKTCGLQPCARGSQSHYIWPMQCHTCQQWCMAYNACVYIHSHAAWSHDLASQ